MDQRKLTLADTITLVTGMLYSFICFLGLYLYSLGNVSSSIWGALLIMAILVGAALGAKILKRANRNFKVNCILELVMLFLFTVFMIVFTYTPFSHFFVLSANKADIQEKLINSIEQAENMFTEYEKYAENRKSSYLSDLKSAVAAEYSNRRLFDSFGFESSSVPRSIQIQTKMEIMQNDLYPSNYSDTMGMKGVKEVALSWLSAKKIQVEDWNPFVVVDVANNVEKEAKQWLTFLKTQSQVLQTNEEENEFPYLINMDDVSDSFKDNGKITLLSVLLGVLAYGLMLFSYFISKRSTKSNCWKKQMQGKFDIPLKSKN